MADCALLVFGKYKNQQECKVTLAFCAENLDTSDDEGLTASGGIRAPRGLRVIISGRTELRGWGIEGEGYWLEQGVLASDPPLPLTHLEPLGKSHMHPHASFRKMR